MNLVFAGKFIERVVVDQLIDHIRNLRLMEPLQLAYRAFHSKETALLKVKSDIHQAMEKQEEMCLVLLNLSATFDTVNHSILLNQLNHHMGNSGTALNWLCSNLTNRSQQVITGDSNTDGAHSNPVPLTFWVSQGSILGPILFTLYKVPLWHLYHNHGITYHLYVDAQQVYLSFCPSVAHADDQCVSMGSMHRGQ